MSLILVVGAETHKKKDQGELCERQPCPCQKNKQRQKRDNLLPKVVFYWMKSCVSGLGSVWLGNGASLSG